MPPRPATVPLPEMLMANDLGERMLRVEEKITGMAAKQASTETKVDHVSGQMQQTQEDLKAISGQLTTSSKAIEKMIEESLKELGGTLGAKADKIAEKVGEVEEELLSSAERLKVLEKAEAAAAARKASLLKWAAIICTACLSAVGGKFGGAIWDWISK